MKRLNAPAQEIRALASEPWKIAGAVGWTQGRSDAEALVSTG
jgi:hypothetical protein